ncbi:hypothetical protein RchiOBHm_Chr5g0011871 [Rosa chinensis]|uniref:Uncharacterized protein n=1 Tax=Rosa chinensis TaxID=74649 RepID=A0A2P6Q4Y3_ROSCH|nr:hypothetical protein RchiOBHm_Chr5g0011871 [Rosa chinensis]
MCLGVKDARGDGKENLGLCGCRFYMPIGAIPSSMLGLETLTGDLDYFGP